MTFATPPGPNTLHPAGYFERAQGSRLPTLSETHQLLVPFPLGVLEVLVIRGAALGGGARLRGRRSCRASPWPSRRYRLRSRRRLRPVERVQPAPLGGAAVQPLAFAHPRPPERRRVLAHPGI